MLVQQRTQYDCALACLAMVSGKPYDELWDAEFCERIEKATTCTDEDLVEAYRRAGFERDKNMRSVYVGQNVNPIIVRALIWGRRAMIQVPSLNHEGSEHFVFWDGRRILDPSTKQTYKFLQHLFPTYVTVFDEAAPNGQDQPGRTG